MATYSFLDVTCAIAGTGGSFSLGSESGAAESGITVAMNAAKNTMTIGADGAVMHSLNPDKSGTVSIRLLKTAPGNYQLNQLYATQADTSSSWGTNTITIRDVARGDTITCQNCAFRKHPDQVYAKTGGVNEWVFDAGTVDIQIGSGSSELED